MKAMDANRYATKKTIAQGMLDIALLTANASQLKYILQVGEQHQFYKLMLILISLSIVMQVLSGVLSLSLSLLRDCRLHQPEFHQSANIINHLLVGILFVVIGSLNINRQQDQTAAVILNDVILVVVFIISVVNVIISGFGIEYSSQPLRLLDQHEKTPYEINECIDPLTFANRWLLDFCWSFSPLSICIILRIESGASPSTTL
uniref:GG19192 n=1 Tax=Drosophila erecta TaxID=7220 RepID=B3P473_DROER